jgi:hypothetical protein
MDNNKVGCKRNDALQELEMLTVNAKEAQQPILSKILEKKCRIAERCASNCVALRFSIVVQAKVIGRNKQNTIFLLEIRHTQLHGLDGRDRASCCTINLHACFPGLLAA